MWADVSDEDLPDVVETQGSFLRTRHASPVPFEMYLRPGELEHLNESLERSIRVQGYRETRYGVTAAREYLRRHTPPHVVEQCRQKRKREDAELYYCMLSDLPESEPDSDFDGVDGSGNVDKEAFEAWKDRRHARRERKQELYDDLEARLDFPPAEYEDPNLVWDIYNGGWIPKKPASVADSDRSETGPSDSSDIEHGQNHTPASSAPSIADERLETDEYVKASNCISPINTDTAKYSLDSPDQIDNIQPTQPKVVKEITASESPASSSGDMRDTITIKAAPSEPQSRTELEGSLLTHAAAATDRRAETTSIHNSSLAPATVTSEAVGLAELEQKISQVPPDQSSEMQEDFSIASQVIQSDSPHSSKKRKRSENLPPTLEKRHRKTVFSS